MRNFYSVNLTPLYDDGHEMDFDLWNVYVQRPGCTLAQFIDSVERNEQVKIHYLCPIPDPQEPTYVQ